MEVGIEECLHIEFEYERTKYHLEDVILGVCLSLCSALVLAIHTFQEEFISDWCVLESNTWNYVL